MSNESKETQRAGFAGVTCSAAVCKRCGKPFKPRLLKALKKMAECCDACGVRNICDGLGLPTPPELLDRHTKLPALTRRDFWAQLDEPPNERTEAQPPENLKR